MVDVTRKGNVSLLRADAEFTLDPGGHFSDLPVDSTLHTALKMHRDAYLLPPW